MKYPSIPLTPTGEKLDADTKVGLMWKAPAFTHIVYSGVMGNPAVRYSNEIPVAATDGKVILFNPEAFFKYKLGERVFIFAHEIVHCILNHPVLNYYYEQRGKVALSNGTTLPYDYELMQLAKDLVVNAILVDGKIGTMPADAIHDPNIASAEDSIVDVYAKLYKAKGNGQDMPGGDGFDEHMKPGEADGENATAAAQARQGAEAQWQQAVAAGLSLARLQGKLPAGIERALQELLTPQVDWRDKIQGMLARKGGSGGYNWRKADRAFIVRDIYIPARSGRGAGDVVVAVDTSASIGDKELGMFLAEVSGILEDMRPTRLFLVWCDAKVQRVDECNDPQELNELRCKGAPGGGGTDFRPVFTWLEQEGITSDALVYLTDGYGDFPAKEPRCPVIWGNISRPGEVRYPFGEVVDVPLAT